ncbi:MAG: DEAD/DEAH box helicase [Alistipes sp.]|nr:DEAD/DEAH box helicase [Candidatus Alistipes equi]
MTLEQWQIALRQQQAQNEHFNITPKKNGVYYVQSEHSKHEYKVVYMGVKSPWNFCSCMDFKTSGLGTCKHIEAVKLKKHGKNPPIPSYTSVYLDYRDHRAVKIRIGTDDCEAFTTLAARYFRKDLTLKKKSYFTFGEFLQKAKQINDSFRCYQDALDFIVENRERKKRNTLIDNKYTDTELDSLLKTKLYPYQKEGIRFAAKAGKAIIADEMGLGKTIQAIGVAELLRREGLITSTLIIAPTSLKYQWKREIEKFTENAEVIVIEGGPLKRTEMYSIPVPYKIVSYNSACNDIKLNGKLECDLLIMDEVQRLKNWNTQISKAARCISSNYSVILSGTPLENKIEELYSIVEFADQYVLAPYYKFRNDCIITDEIGKVIGYQNLNAVGKKLKDIMLRRRKKDVNLQLPARMDKTVFVPMTGKQMDIHEEFKNSVAQIVTKWIKFHFLSETDRQRLMNCLSQMRMVCDSTFILDQKTRNDTKVDEALNIITQVIEGSDDGKVVVFSSWERMTRLIAQELDKREFLYENLHGGVPSAKRKDLVSNFTDNAQCRVFLSTDAGSTGLNLQAASTIINLDLPWNPAVLEQRIARIYRIGQKKNIQVINLVSANTIEESMIGKLKFKTSMFEGILDGGDDVVFANDDKFSKIMELVGEYVETPSSDAEKPEPSCTTVETSDLEPVKENPIQEESQQDKYTENDKEDSFAEQSYEKETTQGSLLDQGISFFSNLVETLKSPEKTSNLLNEIIVEDKESGKTSINIPIKNKQTLSDALSLLGKFLSK